MLTSLPTVSPSLKILSGLSLDNLDMFPKPCNVKTTLQHLLLL